MKKNTLILMLLSVISLAGTVLQVSAETAYPLSDPDNSGGWLLNTSISDEFEGHALDTGKWFVQGTANQFCNWKGRAPSQFAPHNVFVEDGKLKIRSRWEPDYDFADAEFDGRKYENITTSGVISHNKFLYGYMEAKTKAADTSMTSSFWSLGYQSELDMYEQMGNPSHPHQKDFGKTYMFSIHDWRPGIKAGSNRVFNVKHKLPYRVADDFHVYGCEWGEDYLKFYADGNLVYETTQEKLGDTWILTNPLEIWFDSETFPWMGLPSPKDLPADYEIEYVRVWQKPDPNLLNPAFFGFEGPLVIDYVPLPRKGKVTQHRWYMAEDSKPHFSVTDEKFSAGRKSLKFEHQGAIDSQSVSAMSPYRSVQLTSGEYTLSMQVWIEPGSTVKKLHPILEEPWLQLKPFDLTALPKGEWVTLKRTFSRDEISGEKDRLRLVVTKEDAPTGKSTMYIDQVSLMTAD